MADLLRPLEVAIKGGMVALLVVMCAEAGAEEGEPMWWILLALAASLIIVAFNWREPRDG